MKFHKHTHPNNPVKNKKSLQNRLTACVIVVVTVFAAFFCRLAYWQLVKGDEYKAIAGDSLGDVQTVTAIRGEILDRNGEDLVINRTHRKIALDLSEFTQDELDALILTLDKILEETGDSRSTELIPEAADGGEYVFAEDISDKTAAMVSEATQGVSGVEVKTYLEREAVDGDLAPHILGALGAITEDEYQSLTDEGKDYDYDDLIGKFGVELACEDELRGEDGTAVTYSTESGNETVQTKVSTPGNTVYLTLDADIQRAAADALAENIAAAKEAGADDCTSGAAVMLSTDDFSVLAAASYPTYDLNKYGEYGSYYVSLTEDENLPLYNRATVGTFACGSAFKPCVAAGALEENIITDSDKIYCKQSYDYYPSDIVNCMHYHGSLDLYGAVAQSCNYFFADAGRRLGIDKIAAYAENFGLGEYTGIEIEESKGTLAGRDSENWQEGNVVSAAIGQSDNAFTPLQLAAYAAALASGERMQAHLVDKVTNYERTQTVKTYEAQSLGSCGVSNENLNIVRKAMLEVCENESGTAHSVFGNYRVKVAAKTGTAENSGSDHAVFICYAPYENPQAAVAVVLEHGANGKYAMQTAKAMLDAYFDKN